jgi:hypothetical protein
MSASRRCSPLYGRAPKPPNCNEEDTVAEPTFLLPVVVLP